MIATTTPIHDHEAFALFELAVEQSEAGDWLGCLQTLDLLEEPFRSSLAARDLRARTRAAGAAGPNTGLWATS